MVIQKLAMLASLNASLAKFEEHLGRHKKQYLTGASLTFLDVIVFIELDTVQTLFRGY